MMVVLRPHLLPKFLNHCFHPRPHSLHPILAFVHFPDYPFHHVHTLGHIEDFISNRFRSPSRTRNEIRNFLDRRLRCH